MKKIVAGIALLMMIVIFGYNQVYAAENIIDEQNESQLIKIKEDSAKTLEEYKNYCSLIKDIHSKLWPEGDEKDKPYLTEMLIFSLLEDIGFCVSIPEEFKLEFKNT